MKRNQLNKMCMALGLKNSSNPHPVGFPTSVRSERSSMVIPEPFVHNDLKEPNADDAKYEAWVVEHPSALMSFDKMVSFAKGKKMVVFLDYDGTLSPIVDDPELAFMSDTMRSAVREVAINFPTAIISGRSRNKVYDFVQLNDVYYAGSHGMDIMARRQKSVDKKGNDGSIFQPAREFLPEIQKINKELEEAVEKIEGVTVEDNRFCVSVHFRRAKEKDYPLVEERVKLVLAKHPSFHLSKGRKVLEIRPSIKWNKGNAVEYLLETLGLAKSRDVLPIYIGDDTTDEDAFKVIHRRGQGFAILVSKKPKDTMASYSLRDPSEVLTFLLRLARWRRNSSSARI
ncbi:hypothetical protein KSS87_017952 [Heliosperma pusillum]|nr:hypothetical protein KSS87_017952 [Heliosperma pusillum]